MARRVAIALIDGEHYPPVVADALARLGSELEIRAALLLGGAEKLREEPTAATYGVPRLEHAGPEPGGDLAALVAATGAEVAYDLSDEPVVSARSRLRLASHALAAGAGYAGGGFAFAAPRRAPYPHPALAVVGTGKRVGKTAISGHLARRARALAGDVVIVAMGRGGPAAPELIDPEHAPIGLDTLLARSRAGAHAASDFLEDAVLAGVATVGARRCGGGLHGEVVDSNVLAAAELAAARAPGLTVFEGSGAAYPPVACGATLLVTSARTPEDELAGYLGPFRILTADAVVVLGDAPSPSRCDAIREVRPQARVVGARLVPVPASPPAGRRVAVFTTAPADAHAGIRAMLVEEHGLDVVAVSGALADRHALRAALALPAVATAETYLTELKAAAVDVVAEVAAARDLELVLLRNEPRSLDGSDELDRLLDDLVRAAIVANS